MADIIEQGPEGHPGRQWAELTWRDGGVPVAERFDDPYFSLNDGVAETRHVFLEGNGLADRLCPGFSIAELGFGTGLNLAVLIESVPKDCPINFTTFEAFPMSAADASRALESQEIDQGLIRQICGAIDRQASAFQIAGVLVNLKIGDARELLPDWAGTADAWFLDGFSPSKNPEMWESDLMTEVGRHTLPGGTFATFSAAGFVRRNLADAGFEVERVPGFGRKRHMTRGTKA